MSEQGVRIVRAEQQRADREAGGGRATAFNFTGEEIGRASCRERV